MNKGFKKAVLIDSWYLGKNTAARWNCFINNIVKISTQKIFVDEVSFKDYVSTNSLVMFVFRTNASLMNFFKKILLFSFIVKTMFSLVF